ncbi:YlzJ-like family protein [Priestia flexa]|uniref:YlzJ-like family protein n=1 Tax=Priestia flexa TaxID=86664 RepID=UPI001A8CE9E4|nr:YlzJ-like family protein [Priestia flexa]MBN8434649.1 YlzJ-like family protein [Priestia flexa]MCA0967188.1 YlzJ-like family protein [Priestia flexa]
MILYTMMPQELIYPDTTQAELPKQKMMQYNGISMLVEENEYNQKQIVRILSTDPQHYLDKKYYPGQILS